MGGKTYDVLIVGCGIYGAFTAREAALRGLSVAVIDRKDFCGATSANSLKIIHGGLRYLQQFDVVRVLESAKERKNLMRIAPHLVHPLPCAMPTRGFFMRSKPVMFMGMLLNDILTFDRNRDIDPEKNIPGGYVVPLEKFKQMVPGLDDARFNGAAVWHDALAYNTERLAIIALKAAAHAGADAANYAEMVRFVKDGKTVTGVVAKDAFSGEEVTIKAGLVINNTGPWSNETLALLGEQVTMPVYGLALELNFVLKRQLLKNHAVGLSGYRKSDTRERLLFFVPWHGRTMAGTYCRLHAGRLERMQVMEHDINTFLEDLNSAFPSANLTRKDISLVHAGVIPIEEGSEMWPEPEPLRHYRLIDHEKKDGVQGLLTVLGVKYTTARDVAEKSINSVLEKLGKFDGSVSKSSVTPLPGGDIPDFNRFVSDAKAASPKDLSDASLTNLLYSYGTEYKAILDLGKTDNALLKPISDSSEVIAAEIINAVRNEMAQTLSDVVLRRTDISAAGIPDEKTMNACAKIMGLELSWDKARIEKEIAQVKAEVRRV
ncbi:MAG: glycerol-3-phosphate dehydrogenase/oxidase [Kiritimatiellae bacterium]|nr:glycerol-3-phosphate dehydrogenase/oxidase [Kiritimatiellia bacterium]MDD5520838.1 glycerol-3-phosphate dehydrogenase/oxidase [Kiritimatiellia bacterium]